MLQSGPIILPCFVTVATQKFKTAFANKKAVVEKTVSNSLVGARLVLCQVQPTCLI